MTPDFFDRFAAAASPGPSPGLQVLFHDRLDLEVDALTALLRTHPELADVRVELVRIADVPSAEKLVSADGPPPAVLGLVEWREHRVRIAGFDAPMPYGPVESSVGPAMVAPPVKQDAKLHKSHALLDYTGSHPDPLERFVALGAVASVLARLDAIVVMNEEARTAVPAIDLIPDEGEDILHTLRTLPIPYLYAGFVKLDVGDPERPWVRTFAAHRLGLPDLGYRLSGHGETSRVFRLFAGLLGYLRQSGERFEPGDGIDLGGEGRLRLRAPAEPEWFLESEGTMLVLESGEER
jgi:hypothetical protein